MLDYSYKNICRETWGSDYVSDHSSFEDESAGEDADSDSAKHMASVKKAAVIVAIIFASSLIAATGGAALAGISVGFLVSSKFASGALLGLGLGAMGITCLFTMKSLYNSFFQDFFTGLRNGKTFLGQAGIVLFLVGLAGLISNPLPVVGAAGAGFCLTFGICVFSSPCVGAPAPGSGPE